jgi:hypothetical protein
VCEFDTTTASEKSEATKAQVSTPKLAATNASWISAAGPPSAISRASFTCAPHKGSVDWTSATINASISAKCPSSTIMACSLFCLS